MTVLHVIARMAEGSGITESVLGLTRALRLLDACRSGILTLAEDGLNPFATRCQMEEVRLHTAGPGWRHTWWYSRDWLKQLEQIAPEYDLVHIHGMWLYPLLATALWCFQHGVPFVVTPHGGVLPSALVQSGWKKKLFRPWFRRGYRHAACIHVTSEAEAASVRRFWGAQCPPVVCVPEGVEGGRSSLVHDCESALVEKTGEGDLSRKGAKAQSVEDGGRSLADIRGSTNELTTSCTNALPLDSSFILHPLSFTVAAVRTRTVLYLGRVSPEKNLHVLVDAWERLEDMTRKGWVLCLIGFPTTGGNRYAEKLAARCSHVSDIRSEAFCDADRKWSVLSVADVLVLPSLTENFGIVVAEALACGVPVITTKGAPWQELLGSPASSKVLKCESALVPYKPTTSINNKMFYHEEHEEHEVYVLDQAPHRELRGEDSGFWAEPTLGDKPEDSGDSGDSAISAIGALSTVSRESGDSAISASGRRSEFSAMAKPVQGVTSSPKLNAPNALIQLNTLSPAIGRCGWWIDIGVDPLVEALREAMTLTDEERRAMGENGRRLVEAKYQWPAIAKAMEKVYEKCVNAGLR